MAPKAKQCEAKHPDHGVRCWLRAHDPETKHKIVVPDRNKQPVEITWSSQ